MTPAIAVPQSVNSQKWHYIFCRQQRVQWALTCMKRWLSAAGGNLYHELRQGKLMLMPSFTSGFQKMLKWLMAPVPSERPTPARILASSLLQKKAHQRDSSRENYGALPLQSISQNK